MTGIAHQKSGELRSNAGAGDDWKKRGKHRYQSTASHEVRRSLGAEGKQVGRGRNENEVKGQGNKTAKYVIFKKKKRMSAEACAGTMLG